MNIKDKKSSVRVIAAVMGLAIGLTACGGPAEPVNATSVEDLGTAVEVKTMERSTIKNEIVFLGQVEPQKRIVIASRVSAEVQQVFFDIGDTVQEGDVLFTVDAKDINNQIRQLQAAANQTAIATEQAAYGLQIAQEGSLQQRSAELQAQGGLISAYYGARRSNLGMTQARDAVDDAEEALDDADEALWFAQRVLQQLEQERKDMVEQGISGDPLDKLDSAIAGQQTMVRNAGNAVKQAEAGLNAARNARQTALVGRDQSHATLDNTREYYEAMQDAANQTQYRGVEQAQFGLRIAEAAADSTQVQLSIAMDSLGNAQVKSPISGIIAGRSIEVGQMISPQQMPFTVIDMDWVNIEVGISETLINSVFPGDEVEVRIQALGDTVFRGIVGAVSPAAGQTSTFPVRIELYNPDGLIKPGMFAQITFVQDRSDYTFVVDKGVIISDERGQYVYVVRDGEAQKVQVTTGIAGTTDIEILSGISEGDQIVVVGHEYLIDGTKVNIITRNREENRD